MEQSSAMPTMPSSRFRWPRHWRTRDEQRDRHYSDHVYPGNGQHGTCRTEHHRRLHSLQRHPNFPIGTSQLTYNRDHIAAERSSGTQYVFQRWSDGGGISHSVTPSTATTYTASFKTQYYLTTSAGTGGNISPASGYFDSTVQVSATANTNYGFTGFTGDLTGPIIPSSSR